MTAAVSIGFATTGATLLVTVVLFAVERILRIKASRVEARRQLVARVLDALETATRTNVRPPFAQAWTNPEVEYLLLIPRLLLELGRRDRVIALWMQRQVQLMQLTPALKARVKIQAGVAEKLVLWHHNELGRSWFESEYAADPLPSKFVVPLPVRADRSARASLQWMEWIAVLVGFLFLGRQVFSARLK